LYRRRKAAKIRWEGKGRKSNGKVSKGTKNGRGGHSGQKKGGVLPKAPVPGGGARNWKKEKGTEKRLQQPEESEIEEFPRGINARPGKEMGHAIERQKGVRS